MLVVLARCMCGRGMAGYRECVCLRLNFLFVCLREADVSVYFVVRNYISVGFSFQVCKNISLFSAHNRKTLPQN